jgi:hypothetical protein
MKLQILVDQYVFAFNKPARTQRLFNVDIYKAHFLHGPYGMCSPIILLFGDSLELDVGVAY